MNHRTALGAIHLGALLFGLSGVLGKLAMASAVVVVFGRAVFAVLALGVFTGVSGAWQPMARRDVRRLVVAGGLLAAHWVSFFIAVKVAGVAVATLGFASFPAFTVILEGLVFRERVRRHELFMVLLVSVGLALVTPAFDLASQATNGLLWAVLSGLTFAMLSLLNRAGKGVPAVQSALCQNAVVALCLLPFAMPQLGAVRALDWLWIGLLGIFCTGLAHSLFVASLKVIKARTAAVIFALEPVYGIGLAWLIFSETPTARMLLGGVLIVLAIVLASWIAPGPRAKPDRYAPGHAPDR
ncbi:DMT family transporter [Pseudomonas abieticivorans]|uniref:DMT family transporter n=1 Tax=Pseudomonas abieticivorans TaxID=2931382 RepID=UPI0020BF3875|nr:DMT family transporter [Pseudomonas sp. PIA16]